MSLTPADVERKTFKERFKGYDMDEVDAFLDRVVGRLQELEEANAELQRRAQQVSAPSGESEQLIQRTLLTAQRTADETVARAEAEAERLRASAREAAERERERLRDEAEALVRSIDELKAFRSRYLEQVRAAIEGQLGALEREGSIPQVPTEIDELVADLRVAAGEGVDAEVGEVFATRSALDEREPYEGDPHAGE